MYTDMLDDLDEKTESAMDRIADARTYRKRLFDGFDNDKVVNEVLDKQTVMTLFGLIRSKIISYVNGVVKAGKESVVFWGVCHDGSDVALKVYLVSASNFKHRMPYLTGDPRFSRIKKGTRNMVNLWARKEFKNTLQCHNCGIPVAAPIHVSQNVLVSEFIGSRGVPAKTLLESEVDYDDYDSAVSIIKKLYREARLVHGDFSQYNIFKTSQGLVLFDLGSAVDIRHPNSRAFLERDINNITNFFVKRGLTVTNPADILDEVTG